MHEIYKLIFRNEAQNAYLCGTNGKHGEYFFAESRAMDNIRRGQDIPTRLSSQNHLHPLPPYSKYLLKKKKEKLYKLGDRT